MSITEPSSLSLAHIPYLMDLETVLRFASHGTALWGKTIDCPIIRSDKDILHEVYWCSPYTQQCMEGNVTFAPDHVSYLVPNQLATQLTCLAILCTGGLSRVAVPPELTCFGRKGTVDLLENPFAEVLPKGSDGQGTAGSNDLWTGSNLHLVLVLSGVLLAALLLLLGLFHLVWCSTVTMRWRKDAIIPPRSSSICCQGSPKCLTGTTANSMIDPNNQDFNTFHVGALHSNPIYRHEEDRIYCTTLPSGGVNIRHRPQQTDDGHNTSSPFYEVIDPQSLCASHEDTSNIFRTLDGLHCSAYSSFNEEFTYRRTSGLATSSEWSPNGYATKLAIPHYQTTAERKSQWRAVNHKNSISEDPVEDGNPLACSQLQAENLEPMNFNNSNHISPFKYKLQKDHDNYVTNVDALAAASNNSSKNETILPSDLAGLRLGKLWDGAAHPVNGYNVAAGNRQPLNCHYKNVENTSKLCQLQKGNESTAGLPRHSSVEGQLTNSLTKIYDPVPFESEFASDVDQSFNTNTSIFLNHKPSSVPIESLDHQPSPGSSSHSSQPGAALPPDTSKRDAGNLANKLAIQFP